MTTTQLRIAQTLGLFYDDWVVMSQGGREYVRTIERFNEETKTDLVTIFIPALHARIMYMLSISTRTHIVF